jgi:hypothetical protein
MQCVAAEAALRFKLNYCCCSSHTSDCAACVPSAIAAAAAAAGLHLLRDALSAVWLSGLAWVLFPSFLRPKESQVSRCCSSSVVLQH